MCLGGLIAGSFLSSCMSNNYVSATTVGNKLVLSKSSFVLIKEDGSTLLRKYVLVRCEQLQFPVCIYRMGEDSYSALLMECSHNSCELSPHGDYLICPCHGSEFDKTGRPQNPPADHDLRTFKTTTDHENIYLHVA